MKNKNVVLAAVAFLFAIGSAFASMVASTDVWVKAKLSSAPGAPTQCINTRAKCESTGTIACTVRVQTQSGNELASSNGPKYTFSNNTCSIVLFNTTSDEITSQFQSGDAIPVRLVDGN